MSKSKKKPEQRVKKTSLKEVKASQHAAGGGFSFTDGTSGGLITFESPGGIGK